MDTTTDTLAQLVSGVNTVWMLLAAMLVFFMQPGFALVEAGFTRTKNTANILMKNFVDFMVGSDDMNIKGQLADGTWEDVFIDGSWAPAFTI